ncbi:MAG: bifunctional nuclease family protein [SAR324 cluster bacterium]|nr:bifunctional nuclease family protein [SAR324 cluster bacterium]
MRSYPLLLPALLVISTAAAVLCPVSSEAEDRSLVAVRVQKVLLVNNNPVVLLTSEDDDSHLLVFIDHFMAQAIQFGLMDYSIERPMTHDLIGILLRRIGAKVDKITITDLKNDTYYALISLQVNGTTHQIDARPSDALAIAVRNKAPIYVSRKLMTHEAFPGYLLPVIPPGPDAPKHGA